jgi:outer membrane protein assembly factor BamB
MKVSPRWIVSVAGDVRTISMSSDGKFALAVTTSGAYLLDIDSKGERNLGPASHGDISPSGSLVSIAHESRVTLHSVRGGSVGALEFKDRVSACLLTDERIFVGTESGGVYAFKTDGSFIWEAKLDGKVEIMTDDGSNSLLAYQSTKKVSMLDASSGRVKWSAGTLTSVVSMSVTSAGNSFVATVDGRIIEFNPVGAVAWNPRISGRIITSDAAATGKAIAVSDGGAVHIFSEYKTILRKWDCGEATVVRLTENGAYAFVGLANGMVAFIDKEENLWTYHSADPITAGCISSKGTRLVAGMPKKVTVFDNGQIFEDYVHEIVQRLLVAKHFGARIEDAKAFAKNALDKVRIGEFNSALTMLKGAESSSFKVKEMSKPAISIIAAVAESFALNQWTKALTYVMNTGSEHAADLQLVSLTEGIEVQWNVVPSLSVDECIYVEFGIRPIRPGVPRVELEVRFWDYAGKAFAAKGLADIKIDEAKRPHPKPVAVFTLGDKAKVIAAVKKGVKK